MTQPGSPELQRDTPVEGKLLSRVYQEVGRVWIGERGVVEVLLATLLAEGHALLEGVPGVAKTTLVKVFAESLGCDYKRIQFTPDLLPSDITGTHVLNLSDNSFALRRGPVFTQILLGDEINRAPAKTQSALLEAMQESQVTIEGNTSALPSPFMVLATQNPLEHDGVYPLPQAQLDRFMVKIRVGYPSETDEVQILATHDRTPPPVRPVLHADEILAHRRRAAAVHVEEGLRTYIVALARYTRSDPDTWNGVSPRAGLALMKCAKARALLHGRDYLLPDDIQQLIVPCLGHRITLAPRAEHRGTRVEDILQRALESVTYAPAAPVHET